MRPIMGVDMKLWILEPVERKDAPEGIDWPWDPWFDKTFQFVIRAASEKEARHIAKVNAGEIWLNPKLTTCTELTPEGEVGVICEDVREA